MRFRGLFKRNLIEMLRDPLTLILALGLPVFLLLLFSLISKTVEMPIDMFQPGQLAPGIACFSFSMLMMSQANLIAADRNSSLFDRLKTLPLKTTDFMLGYSLPYLLMGIGQYIITFVVALCFGLTPSWHILTGLIVLFPIAIIFVGLGLMMGLSLNVNQVVGLGNMAVILSAMLSGAWMPVELMGGVVKTVAKILPFYNAVSFSRQLLAGQPLDWSCIYILAAYTVGVGVIAWFVSRYKLIKK